MNRLSLAFVLLSVFPAGGALAHGHDAPSASGTPACCESPARWADRYDTRDARLAIDSEDGDVTLLITDRVVAFQLSDRTMRKVRRELRNEQDEEDNPIARAVLAVVASSMRTLLNHSAECPVRELRDVQYHHGRLVFSAEDGDVVFGDLDLNDREVTESFSDADARRFVAEFQRVKRRLR